MKKKTNLSSREQAALQYIRQYSSIHGYSPSLREIAEAIEVNSTSLTRFYVRNLEKEGVIKRERAKARSIVVVEGV